MAELYSAGKKPTRETIDEIISMLETLGLYLNSEVKIRDCRNVLMKEYIKFIETHEKEKIEKGSKINNVFNLKLPSIY